MPELREQRVEIESKNDAIVTQFRFRKYGHLLLHHLAINVVESQEAKEKEKFKSEMWSKVNGWLGDLDKK